MADKRHSHCEYIRAPSDWAPDDKDKQEHHEPHKHHHHKLQGKDLSWRAKVFLTMEEPEYSWTARFISAALNLCILLSVVVFVMGTMPHYQHQPHHCHKHMVVGRVCRSGDGNVTSVTVPEHHNLHIHEASHDSHRKRMLEAHSINSSMHMEDIQNPGAPAASAVLAADHSAEDTQQAADGSEHSAEGFEGEECEEVCEPEPNESIEIAEGFAMAVFTVDYLLRMATVHAVPFSVLHPEGYVKHEELRHVEPHGFMKTFQYFFHIMNLVDFLALFPYYFRTIVERTSPQIAELAILRVFRLLRVFRVAPFYMHMVVSTHGVVKAKDKPHLFHIIDLSWLFNFLRLGDYAEGAPLFFTTLRASVPAILVFVVFSIILTVAAGTVYYLVERGHWMATAEYDRGAYLIHNTTTADAHGWMEASHANIFTSMWYVVSDTTTMPTSCLLKPLTLAGKIVDVCLDYLALLIITMPVAIVARNFHDQYEAFFRSWDIRESEWGDSDDEADSLADADEFMKERKEEGSGGANTLSKVRELDMADRIRVAFRSHEELEGRERQRV